jgi:hypothetical protein
MANEAKRSAAIQYQRIIIEARFARINILDGHTRLAFFRSLSSKTPPVRHDEFLLVAFRIKNVVYYEKKLKIY